MKQYHKNPRQITDRQFEQLGDSLDELGDLSGIVHDLNSDEVIGGNQRSKVFNINHCEIEFVGQFDEPDAQGTVAHGFVIWKNARYAYRQVRWTPEQCEAANIIANKAGGTWDFDILANEFDVPDLLGWGFKEWELGIDGEGNDIDELWQGMPEFEHEDKTSYQSIHVHFKNEEEVIEFSKLIKQSLTNKTRSIWFSEREQMLHKGDRYVA